MIPRLVQASARCTRSLPRAAVANTVVWTRHSHTNTHTQVPNLVFQHQYRKRQGSSHHKYQYQSALKALALGIVTISGGKCVIMNEGDDSTGAKLFVCLLNNGAELDKHMDKALDVACPDHGPVIHIDCGKLVPAYHKSEEAFIQAVTGEFVDKVGEYTDSSMCRDKYAKLFDDGTVQKRMFVEMCRGGEGLSTITMAKHSMEVEPEQWLRETKKDKPVVVISNLMAMKEDSACRDMVQHIVNWAAMFKNGGVAHVVYPITNREQPIMQDITAEFQQ